MLTVKDLTPREVDVLKYVSDGCTNGEIADNLAISVHTVKAHLEHLYYKFDVHNRVQLTIKAVQYGIIDINQASSESVTGF